VLVNVERRVDGFVLLEDRECSAGAELGRRIASVYSVRAELVFKHVIYLDQAEALAAAWMPLRQTRRP
jgi:hypothetical protein